jgi:hypothetical protein
MSTGISLIPPLEIGGSIATGQVAFGTAAGVIGGDALLTWDNVNKRLGVGVTSPAEKFHVFGGAAAIRIHSTTNESSLKYNNSTTTAAIKLANNDLKIELGSSEVIRFLAGGNVGIGTSTPTARLHVQSPGALSTDIAFRVRNSANTGDLLSLNGLGNLNLASGGFIYGDTTNPFIRLSNQFGTQIGYGTNFFNIGGAQFNFHTSFDVASLRYRSTWGMRLQDSGNATDPASDGLSAMLALGSTTKGFLPPRMTTVQKNAIVAPPSGLLVYDTSLNKLCLFGASSWETITSI